MAVKEINILETFEYQKQLVFAYLSCERVFPNYAYFSSQYGFGNLETLRMAIDYIYNNIFHKQNINNIDSILQQVDINAPVPANFTTFYASIAMNAAGVIYESFNLLKQSDNARILGDISTMCTDAIDLLIQERDDMDYDDANFEETILNDPLMQLELSIQTGIISYLGKIKNLTSSDIVTLLQLQKKGTGTLVPNMQ